MRYAALALVAALAASCIGDVEDSEDLGQYEDGFWTTAGAAPYRMGGVDRWCPPCDPPPGPNAEDGEGESALEYGDDLANWPIYTYPGDPGPQPDSAAREDAMEPGALAAVADAVFDWRDEPQAQCLNKGQPCYNTVTGRGGQCCGALQCLFVPGNTQVKFCCGCVGPTGACLAVSQCNL